MAIPITILTSVAQCSTNSTGAPPPSTVSSSTISTAAPVSVESTATTVPSSSGSTTVSSSVKPSSDKPVIIMDPDSGVPESRITVHGTGFRPGERVRITWAPGSILSEVLREATVTPDGSFGIEVTIPNGYNSVYDKGGSIRVQAVGLASERSADTYFIVEPK
ncbi:hypothetical protein [Nocardia paucivorans]|uniref:hypothetical protein n=1 Tax=Nocardia paucivorans TaxID=114259 RepID=UPI0012F85CB2|nr:hypothetical protein [Nocardia paucivorans]